MADLPGKIIIESENDALAFLSNLQFEMDALGLVIIQKSLLTDDQLAQVKTIRANAIDPSAHDLEQTA